ncbi:MAG: glutaminyl-peptide cyclotransferase [Vicinamibacterales bacterium]
MRSFSALVLGVAVMSLIGRVVGFASSQAASALPMFGYTVVHTYPHDRDAFTQGLQVLDGAFYEGTGLNGRSSIRKVKIDTGEVLQKRDVPAQYFGEGITVRGNELFQLTWQSGVALVYDRATFAPKRQLKYSGEGWGLTQDKTALIMSDGSEFLRFLDPATFAEKRRVRVTVGGAPLKNLNELEYVKGEVFANVWQTDYVARIDPATGNVNGYIDFRGLLTSREREATDVLNGIAYDEATDRLFITGKLWPRVFEVRVTRK